jgi:hypothetical protein
MLGSEVVTRLIDLIEKNGDMHVFLDVGPDGLLRVEEIGIDVEDSGIIIWSEEEEGKG